MKVFPNSWKLQEAHKVCSHIVDCINKTAPVVDFETPYKMIRTTNIKKGCINLNGARSVSEATFIKWNRRLTPKYNDIILTREAPLGDVGIVRGNEKIFLGQRTMLYRSNPKVLDQHFLYYTLLGSTLQAQLKTLGSGSTVEHVRVPDAEKLLIPFPPLPIQKKIAAILSAYDDLIENNKRRIALLENMAEEIYREWFVRFRFPDHEKTEFVKGIPKGWGIGHLNDFTNIIMGQSPKSKFYNNTKDGLPFHQGVGSYGDRFPINEIFCSVDGRKAKTGDILFSVRAPVGRLNIANREIIIGRGLAAISHNNGYNSYLYYLLKTAFTNEDIIGNGAIFNSVGKNELNAFKVFLPSKPLVANFENQVSVIDQQISILFHSVENLTKTKNMLLPRLISGKLSVEDLDISFPPSMQDDHKDH